MSPGPMPVIFPRRISDSQLARYRAMAERMDEDEHCHMALLECVEELEKLYAEAVAQVMVEAPLPKVSDLDMESQFPLRRTKIKVLAKRLDPSQRKESWIGAAAETIHTVIGKSEEEVRRHLDKVTE